MLRERRFEVPDVLQGITWRPSDERGEFLRLEDYESYVALTWSTSWNVAGLRGLLDVHGGPRRTPTLRLPAPIRRASLDEPLVTQMSDMRAMVVRNEEDELELKSCADLAEELKMNPNSISFVRIEFEDSAIVWARTPPIAKRGPTLGWITPGVRSQYLIKLLKSSGTPGVRSKAKVLSALVEEELGQAQED